MPAKKRKEKRKSLIKSRAVRPTSLIAQSLLIVSSGSALCWQQTPLWVWLLASLTGSQLWVFTVGKRVFQVFLALSAVLCTRIKSIALRAEGKTRFRSLLLVLFDVQVTRINIIFSWNRTAVALGQFFFITVFGLSEALEKKSALFVRHHGASTSPVSLLFIAFIYPAVALSTSALSPFPPDGKMAVDELRHGG